MRARVPPTVVVPSTRRTRAVHAIPIRSRYSGPAKSQSTSVEGTNETHEMRGHLRTSQQQRARRRAPHGLIVHNQRTELRTLVPNLSTRLVVLRSAVSAPCTDAKRRCREARARQSVHPERT